MVFFDVAARILQASGAPAAVVAAIAPAWTNIGPLLDVPKPKGAACLACIDGFVHVVGRTLVLLQHDEAPLPLEQYRPSVNRVAGGSAAFALGREDLAYVYRLASGHEPLLASGVKVAAGTALTNGVVSMHDLLDVLGERPVRAELGRALRAHMSLDDATLEALLDPMFNFVEIVEVGDSGLELGTVLRSDDFNARNEALVAEGQRPVIGRQVLLGYMQLAARLILPGT